MGEIRPPRLTPLWGWLAGAAAIIAGAGNILGLFLSEEVYGQETTALANAAIAQDIVNLFVVVPVIAWLIPRALHGHLLPWLCLLGVLAFMAYNNSIYLFSVHFGPLFLLWVAVLGLAVFALAGSFFALGAVHTRPVRLGWQSRLPGWFLVGTALLFAAMWLHEILPDMLAGTGSTSAEAWRVPTNPVHVLDLAIFLPSVAASGVLLLRQRRLGGIVAPAARVFLALTYGPILVTAFTSQIRGDAPGWAVVAPIGLYAVATLLVLWRLLKSIGSAIGNDQGSPTAA